MMNVFFGITRHLAVAAGVFCWAIGAWAAAPNLMTYQGKLSDAQGDPLTGNYSMTFSIYAQPTGGSALFSETHGAVFVDNGVFYVALGGETSGGIAPSVFQGGVVRYLGVSVGGDAEMTPRERLLSAPYALAVAEGSIGEAEIDTASLDNRYVTLVTSQTITAPKIFNDSVLLAATGGQVGVGLAAPSDVLEVAGAVVRRGFIQIYNTTIQSQTSGPNLILNFNQETRRDADYFERPSNTQIRVLRDGWYRVSYSIQWQSYYNNRSVTRTRMFQNGIPVSLSLSYVYLRNNTSGRYGTTTATFILPLTANALLDIRSQQSVDGTNFTSTQDVRTRAQECWVMIEKI